MSRLNADVVAEMEKKAFEKKAEKPIKAKDDKKKDKE